MRIPNGVEPAQTVWMPCLLVWFNRDQFGTILQSNGYKCLARFPFFMPTQSLVWDHYSVSVTATLCCPSFYLIIGFHSFAVIRCGRVVSVGDFETG